MLSICPPDVRGQDKFFCGPDNIGLAAQSSQAARNPVILANYPTTEKYCERCVYTHPNVQHQHLTAIMMSGYDGYSTAYGRVYSMPQYRPGGPNSQSVTPPNYRGVGGFQQQLAAVGGAVVAAATAGGGGNLTASSMSNFVSAVLVESTFCIHRWFIQVRISFVCSLFSSYIPVNEVLEWVVFRAFHWTIESLCQLFSQY